MARTELSLQTTSRDGLNPSYSAGDAANGHSFDNASEKVILHVKNGGASPVVVTVLTGATIDGISLADKTINVPVGEERVIGPFPDNLYSQEDTDNEIDEAVLVDLDQDSSVTLAAIKLGAVSY